MPFLFVYFSILQLHESQNPPLPLDLDVPYNDDFSIFRPSNNNKPNIVRADVGGIYPPPRKNIIVNTYNPNSDHELRNGTRPNIIVNSYDINSNVFGKHNNSQSPNHKTHVEIITKHGATKKPNGIIGNNYTPPKILTSANYVAATNINQHMRNNGHDNGDNSMKSQYDRKSTCMLYLQADHTFFQKMGSEEASIEAITRHVQRANVIYKNTGELWFYHVVAAKSFIHSKNCWMKMFCFGRTKGIFARVPLKPICTIFQLVSIALRHHIFRELRMHNENYPPLKCIW